jgi:hypothetical protein
LTAYNMCLKFNRSFEIRRWENRLMGYEMPLLKRFLTKLVHDVLPAALASVIGGFLFTHFQLGRAPEAAAAQVTPASPEMMQLLRDEHGLIVNFLNAQLANEKKQLAADESAPRISVERQQTAAVAASRGPVAAPTAAKLISLRGKAAAAGASLQPLLIAQAQLSEGAKASARNENSLLAKTIGIKDHVVAVTHSVVSAIGGIPSWIGSIGDKIGGEDATPRPSVNLISAS